MKKVAAAVSLPVQARKLRKPRKKKLPPSHPQQLAKANARDSDSSSSSRSSSSSSSKSSGSTDSDNSDCGSEESDGGSANSDSDKEEGKSGYRRGGYHPVTIGDMYNFRYKVVSKVGWGHFSTVWKALDTKEPTDKFTALKIVKSSRRYTEAAVDEIEILNVIAERDPANTSCCCHLLDHFKHAGPNGTHVCMVFELLGSNILDLIKLYHYRGIPIPIVKYITKQVLIGLDYMHTKCSLIHTDLKPENVLLCATLDPVAHKVFLPPSLPAEIPSLDTTETSGTTTQPLTKSMKKRLKKKQKKAASGTSSETQSPATDSPKPSPIPSPRTLHVVRKHYMIFANTLKHPETRLQENSKESEASAPVLNEIPVPVPVPVPVPSSIPVSKGANEQSETLPEAPKAKPVACQADVPPINWKVKIADFGNANWVNKRFTNDIQTRQYRAPEVILGNKWDTSVDMWSLACMVFELLTGDFLFEPRTGDTYSKEDDHLAQFIELLGPIPRRLTQPPAKNGAEFFTRTGTLKHIRAEQIKSWPLHNVLQYKFSAEDAVNAAAFMIGMLSYDINRRMTAAEALTHPWLRDVPDYMP